MYLFVIIPMNVIVLDAILFFISLKFIWPYFIACGILVPWQGIEPTAPSIGNTKL